MSTQARDSSLDATSQSNGPLIERELTQLFDGDDAIPLAQPLKFTLQRVVLDGDVWFEAIAPSLYIEALGDSEAEAIETLCHYIVSHVEIYLLSGMKLSPDAQELANELRKLGVEEQLRA